MSSSTFPRHVNEFCIIEFDENVDDDDDDEVDDECELTGLRLGESCELTNEPVVDDVIIEWLLLFGFFDVDLVQFNMRFNCDLRFSINSFVFISIIVSDNDEDDDFIISLS